MAASQPPPATFSGTTGTSVDFSTGASGTGSAKSALDDLNESIRQAMTVRSTSPGLSSSPAKQTGGGGGH